jgi:RND family efflux transporter MFP subunit
VGLMDEEGFPHKGHLDYVSPEVDPNTGTIQVRGVFSNPDRVLLPGFFVRIRIPTGKVDQNALLVPDRALGQNQEGRYLLVLNKDDVVEQRKVKLGQQVGDLRIIESGIAVDDRVIVAGLQRAIPGKKVKPEPTAIASVAPPPAIPSAASAPASAPAAPSK